MTQPHDDTTMLLAQREKSWGDPVATHQSIAEVWSGILDHPISAHQVALMMVGLKLVRASINPTDPDSLDDAAGYVMIGQRIMAAEVKLNEEAQATGELCLNCGGHRAMHTEGLAICPGRYQGDTL